MVHKKLKYLQYLSDFPNCPSSDCMETNSNAYRWVHKELSSNDFLPTHLIKSPPARMIDNNDLMCIGYGLSMFDSLNNALDKYKKLYSRKSATQRRIFTEDMGTVIATLGLKEADGVASKPVKTNYGHFTFHEYECADLANSISDVYSIFAEDGEYNS